LYEQALFSGRALGGCAL